MVAVQSRICTLHDRLVELIASEVRQVVSPTAHMHKHSCFRGSWCDVDDDVFSCGSNTPDIVVVGGGQGEGLILEVDGYMEKVFAEKLLQYQPLVACWDSLGCRCISRWYEEIRETGTGMHNYDVKATGTKTKTNT